MKNSFRLLPCLFVILALVIVFPLLSGCAGPDKSNRFIQLLRLIPASTDINENFIIINDYASCFEDIGISLAELDEKSATFQELIDLIMEKEIKPTAITLGSGSFITGWDEYAGTGIITDRNVGYNYASLDAGIQAGLPPHEMTAAIGRYDSQATRDALSHQEEWPSWAVDSYTTEEYRGVTIHTWGEGYKMHIADSLVPPHIDMLGRAKPLAVTDDYLFYAAPMDTVKSMIDASQDKAESLADLSEYADIVKKMSELGVYSILLGNGSLANGDPGESRTYIGPRLKKFVTFGSAPGNDESGIYVEMILYHENSDDAEANVALLKQRIDTTYSSLFNTLWTEIVTETDVRAEGNLLIAKLYTEHPSFWEAWVYNEEPLLLHEQ